MLVMERLSCQKTALINLSSAIMMANVGVPLRCHDYEHNQTPRWNPLTPTHTHPTTTHPLKKMGGEVIAFHDDV